MNGYLPKKNLIFFNPGKSGVVFTHAANYYITAEQLIRVQERLAQKTTSPVIYIEDRRAKTRVHREAGPQTKPLRVLKGGKDEIKNEESVWDRMGIKL